MKKRAVPREAGSARINIPAPAHGFDVVPEKLMGQVVREFVGTPAPEELFYGFGGFRLLPARQLLLHGDAPVKLGGRAFELLYALVQQRGIILSKDDLMAAAWPGIFVHESNLKVNMHSLRRTLGDTDKPPAYIATVAGRGYRFVAPVEVGTQSPAPAAEVLDAPALALRRAEPPPLPAGGLVGRMSELAELVDRLGRAALVTVVGPAGVGKTTLALAAARALEPAYADGICFVDFATIDDPALVPTVLATALGIKGDREDALAAALNHLRDRAELVLLDNCEHVLPGVAIVARKVVDLGGQSKLLATSRQPLGVPAEDAMWVDPLTLPAEGPTTTPALLASTAVELFLRRASEWSGYELNEADGPVIADICRSLDGLPLALELAAGELGVYAPRDLLARLNEHLGLAERRTAAGHQRHETVLAAIDWSFGLLTRNEAALLLVVSVFAGTFDLDDAVSLGGAVDLSPVDVIAALGGLVTKSLLTAQVHGAGLRYRLLDSTRRYASQRRHDAGIDAAARRSLAGRMMAVFEQAETEWGWRDADDWTHSYLSRLADVRTALGWAFGEGGDVALGIRLTVAAIPLWFERSLMAESQERVELALQHSRAADCPPLLRAKLATSLAWSLMYGRVLVPRIESAWQVAVSGAAEAGNVEHQLQALVGFAVYLMDVGRSAEAVERLVEFRALSELHQNTSLTAEGERTLAWITAHQGDLAASLATLEDLARRHARLGKSSRMAGFQVDRYIGIRNYMTVIAWLCGRADQAGAAAADAISVAGQVGHLASQANVLALAGCPVAYLSGDQTRLATYVAKLRDILEQEHIGVWLPLCRFYAAVCEEAAGEPTAVDRMLQATDAIRDSRFVMRLPSMMGIAAEALTRHGRLDEARHTITGALELEARLGERWCRAELWRIEAGIIQSSGDATAAERLLRAALAEAHAVGARGFTLRVANDVAAHLLAKDRRREAMELLAPVYDGFTEGFGTEDFRRATTLLSRAQPCRA